MRQTWFPAEDVRRLTPMPALINALAQAFAAPPITPARTHHAIGNGLGIDGHLLLMPSWREGGHLGVKILTLLPWLAAAGKPAIRASYIISDAATGDMLAVMDGTEITTRRTAATSALASRYLSRPDSESLLVIGAGALAGPLIEAHGTVRNLKRVLVWARRPERAGAIVLKAKSAGFEAEVAVDLEVAVREADIISCATASATPLVRGEWLSAGKHLDLIGAYTPAMCEADPAAVAAAIVFVDDRDAAQREAGDLIQAEAAGRFRMSDIVASLTDLAAGRLGGRRDAQDVTLFKSVGLALEDLAAAELVLARASES